MAVIAKGLYLTLKFNIKIYALAFLINKIIVSQIVKNKLFLLQFKMNEYLIILFIIFNIILFKDQSKKLSHSLRFTDNASSQVTPSRGVTGNTWPFNIRIFFVVQWLQRYSFSQRRDPLQVGASPKHIEGKRESRGQW